MENSLTDRQFWQNYWANYQYKKISANLFFDKYIDKDENEKQPPSFIEIGGFPGEMSIHFYKSFGFKVSFLDYYVDKDIVNKLEIENNIPENTIRCFEGDFFNHTLKEKFDLVFSYGFIEHFEDTEDVINRHIQLLSDQGQLLIILPNFRGINGLFQRIFDIENFKVHNLNSMIIANLEKSLSSMKNKNLKIEYAGKPMIWLTPRSTIGNKIARPFVKMFSYFLKLFPFKGQLLSPYIVISAKNTKSS